MPTALLKDLKAKIAELEKEIKELKLKGPETCSACRKPIGKEEGFYWKGKPYHFSCLPKEAIEAIAHYVGLKLDIAVIREREREEISHLYEEYTKNWKQLKVSPLTSLDEKEKIEELTQSLQKILEKHENLQIRKLFPDSPQEIITTARVEYLLEKFFSQPPEKRKRVLNSKSPGTILKEFIDQICLLPEEKEVGILISLVVKKALGGLQKRKGLGGLQKRKGRSIAPRHAKKTPPWYKGKGELRHELLGKYD